MAYSQFINGMTQEELDKISRSPTAPSAPPPVQNIPMKPIESVPQSVPQSQSARPQSNGMWDKVMQAIPTVSPAMQSQVNPPIDIPGENKEEPGILSKVGKLVAAYYTGGTSAAIGSGVSSLLG